MVGNLYCQGKNSVRGAAQSMGEIQTASSEILFYAHGGQNRRIIINATDMEEKDIKTVKTTRGELRYYRDWGNYDGGIVMLNAQTIDRYKDTITW